MSLSAHGSDHDELINLNDHAGGEQVQTAASSAADISLETSNNGVTSAADDGHKVDTGPVLMGNEEAFCIERDGESGPFRFWVLVMESRPDNLETVLQRHKDLKIAVWDGGAVCEEGYEEDLPSLFEAMEAYDNEIEAAVAAADKVEEDYPIVMKHGPNGLYGRIDKDTIAVFKNQELGEEEWKAGLPIKVNIMHRRKTGKGSKSK